MEISDKKEEEQKERERRGKRLRKMGRRRRGEQRKRKKQQEQSQLETPARVSDEHGQVSLAGVIETEKTTADSELRIPT